MFGCFQGKGAAEGEEEEETGVVPGTEGWLTGFLCFQPFKIAPSLGSPLCLVPHIVLMEKKKAFCFKTNVCFHSVMINIYFPQKRKLLPAEVLEEIDSAPPE